MSSASSTSRSPPRPAECDPALRGDSARPAGSAGGSAARRRLGCADDWNRRDHRPGTGRENGHWDRVGDGLSHGAGIDDHAARRAHRSHRPLYHRQGRARPVPRLGDAAGAHGAVYPRGYRALASTSKTTPRRSCRTSGSPSRPRSPAASSTRRGEPLANIDGATRWASASARPSCSASGRGCTLRTDDQGRFRVFGLSAGDVVLVAEAGQGFSVMGGAD